MNASTRRFALVPLLALVAVFAACSDTTAPNSSLSPLMPNFIVTIDPETGLGFVGKGDVQTPFGFNNAVMQAHHQHIRFKLVELEQVEQDCQIDTNDEPGRPNWVVVGTRVKTTAVGSQISSASRNNGNQTNWVGWNLIGLGTAVLGDADWGPGPNNGCEEGTPVGAPRVIGSSGESLIAYDNQSGIGSHPVFGEYVIWTPPAE